MLRAAWRQIFEEAWEEKGNWRIGLEDADELEGSGDGRLVIWQQDGAIGIALRGSRSQCRFWKMGISWKAQKRWVLILALVSISLLFKT